MGSLLSRSKSDQGQSQTVAYAFFGPYALPHSRIGVLSTFCWIDLSRGKLSGTMLATMQAVLFLYCIAVVTKTKPAPDRSWFHHLVRECSVRMPCVISLVRTHLTLWYLLCSFYWRDCLRTDYDLPDGFCGRHHHTRFSREAPGPLCQRPGHPFHLLGVVSRASHPIWEARDEEADQILAYGVL